MAATGVDQRQGPDAEPQPRCCGGSADVEIVEVEIELLVEAHTTALQCAGPGRQEHTVEQQGAGGSGAVDGPVAAVGIAVADLAHEMVVVPGRAVGQTAPGTLSGLEPAVPGNAHQIKGL